MKFSSLVISAAFATSVMATPPACLLACVSKVVKQSECSGLNDLSCICSKKYHDIEDCLRSTCPNNPSDSGKDASSALENTCKEQGKSTGDSGSSSSNSSSSTTSSSGGSSSPSSSAISSQSSEGSFTILPVSSGTSVAQGGSYNSTEGSSGNNASGNSNSGNGSDSGSGNGSDSGSGNGSDNSSGNGSGSGIGGFSPANNSVSDLSAATLSTGATSPGATSASAVPGIMSQAGADSVGLSVGALLAGIVGIGLL